MTATSAIAEETAATAAGTAVCLWEDAGRLGYDAACELQERLVAQRKAGEITDRLVFVEHPPVITLGRNAHDENILLPPERLAEMGIELRETNRGGDVTFHGPGQIVGYPILDLKEWQRDVVAYLRALEQALIDAVAEFGISARREPGCTGVWTDQGKLAAMGVHISRWVTSHGFALNHTTDLRYFSHIIPCGITKPVTSMESLLGQAPPHEQIIEAIAKHFGKAFGRQMRPKSLLSSNQDSAKASANSRPPLTATEPHP